MMTNWAELAKEEGFYLDKQKVVPRKDAKSKPEIITWSADRSKLYDGKMVEYRRIPKHPDYYISQNGDVKNLDGQTLRRKVTSSDSQISLRIGVKNKNFYKFILLHQAWPELAPVYFESYFVYRDEVWKDVVGFPGYAVSTGGSVLRLKNFTRLTNNKGRVFMSLNGKQVSRSVNRLCLETWDALPNEIKPLKEHEYRGYGIKHSLDIVNLKNNHVLTQFRHQVVTRRPTESGYESIVFNVKQLGKRYF